MPLRGDGELGAGLHASVHLFEGTLQSICQLTNTVGCKYLHQKILTMNLL